jgi:hypothetical protein
MRKEMFQAPNNASSEATTSTKPGKKVESLSIHQSKSSKLQHGYLY